jgi:hypothetical protein
MLSLDINARRRFPVCSMISHSLSSDSANGKSCHHQGNLLCHDSHGVI